MLNFDQLRTLVAVADYGSMTGAAAALCCTQPAVSRQIAALERRTDTILVVRTPTGTWLTPAGQLLTEHARVMIDRMTCAERQLAGACDQIRIGSFSSANTSLMPAAIREYLRRNRGTVRPVLSTARPEDHLSAVRAGRLDVAVVTEWDLGGQNLDGVELIPLAKDELLLAFSVGHRLARGRVRLADLTGLTWIGGAHPDCLGPFEGMLGECGNATTIGLQCDDWTGKLGLVASGSGVTLFPTLALPARDGVILRRLENEVLPRRIYLASLVGSHSVPAVASLIDILRETAAA